MEQIIEFPDVLELVEQHKLPKEIYAPERVLLVGSSRYAPEG
jgi:hypothetical protein